MTGFLLVGGQGRRLGGAKAIRPFRDQPLWSYGQRLLEQCCDHVTLLGKCPELNRPTLVEPEPGQGPLGALLCALQHSPPEGCLVLALDYPLLGPSIIERLRPPDDDWQARLPRCGRQRHPLCGFYHPRALPALWAAYQAGERSVRRALEGVVVDWIDFEETDAFLNVNHPADLQ